MDVDPVAAVENPTVLPATGKTPLRNIRLAEDLWQELKEAAEYEGKTVSRGARRYVSSVQRKREGR